MIDQGHLDSIAADAAEHAHERLFHSRRGTIEYTDANLVALYDNNPFAGDATLRGRIHAHALAELGALGIVPLARGSYPGHDDVDGQPGYTTAHLFREADADRVCGAFTRAVRHVIAAERPR